MQISKIKRNGSFSPSSGNPLNWNCCKYIQSMNHKKNNKYFQIQHKACVGLWFATNLSRSQNLSPVWGGRGGGTPLYKPYRYVRPKGYGFWGLLGLKTDIHFAHLGLDSSMVFEGTSGAYERIYRYSDSNWMRKNKREGAHSWSLGKK